MPEKESEVLIISSLGGDQGGGGLFAWDGGEVETIDQLSTLGISLCNSHFLRLLRAGDDINSMGEMLVYDQRGVKRYYRIDILCDAHDVAWDGENYVVVSTGSNSILWMAPSGEIVRTWRAPGEDDSWHVNCLCIRDGIVYVSAFGKFQKYRGWANAGLTPAGLIYDPVAGRDAVTGLIGPHNPRFIDGTWTVLNSPIGEMWQIDETGRIRRQIKLTGYLRGLAVSNEYFFVGSSSTRKDHDSSTRASVIVIDREDWKVIDYIPLHCREIYDLVLTPPSLVQGLREGFSSNRFREDEQRQISMFQKVGVEPLLLWATGEALPPEACEIRIHANVPPELEAGKHLFLDCTVENRSGVILVSAPPYPVVLSYRWLDKRTRQPVGESLSVRTMLLKPLFPGEQIRMKFRLLTPRIIGEFGLRVTLRQEKVAWFDDLNPLNGWEEDVRIVEGADGNM